VAHQILSAALGGIDAQLVRVQIDSAPGLHSFSIVGLPDKAVQESGDRIGAAIRSTGLQPPASKNRRFVVNLAPADLRKEGSGFDLPIAVAYLLETGQAREVADLMLVGELGLAGELAHTSGILAAALLAKEQRIRGIIVPSANAAEAAAVAGIDVLCAENLSHVLGHLNGTAPLSPVTPDKSTAPAYGDDSFSYIQGQRAAKRGLIVAAAGGHNILMSGTPGSGKTLLARALAGILPPMQDTEALEVAKIYSACGLLKGPVGTLARPFCAPHHTASPAAIVGGGSTVRPGQISLAHRGVLFLDELPEFARNVLEALRQPLEDGIVSVSRASGTLTLPAKFMLVAAMNPCPCGNLGDPDTSCVCTASAVSRYAKRVSGPLMDRMDIRIAVSREGVQKSPAREDIDGVRSSIAAARERQAERLRPFGMVTNSELSHRTIDALCSMEASAEHLLTDAVNRHRLSLRAYHKTKKVARTIADLENSANIRDPHIAEALALRIREPDAAGSI